MMYNSINTIHVVCHIYAIVLSGDKRKPDEIFKNGFSPRYKISDNKWLNSCLRGNFDAVDANSNYCISISDKFESACIFPINNNEDDVYIYVLALPKPTRKLPH